MAKLSDLVLLTSQITGLPEATVREVSRRLREAGLIQTGKGGRYGGADMMPKDAVSLLTGLSIVRAFSVPITEIAPITRAYLRRLTSHRPHRDCMVSARWDTRLALTQLRRLKSGHTFEDAFTALIASFSNGEFEREMVKWNGVNLIIELYGALPGDVPDTDPGAIIYLNTGTFGEHNLAYIRHGSAGASYKVLPKNWSEIPGPSVFFDLTVSASYRLPTLKSIGLLLKNSGLGARVQRGQPK
jgi:hypothetical protein